ncbi:MAG: hypothetical protein Q7T71_16260 [Herbiconiux sp.]|nr:hypothetical protein [Herbiconiux sp.]
MPYRTKQTLEAWVAEFDARIARPAGSGAAVEVLRHAGDPGEDTGLIVVRLMNASTDVHLAPVAPGSPSWEVTFGPRSTFFSLDRDALRSLSAELALAADLCAFLELKSLEAQHGGRPAEALPA